MAASLFQPFADGLKLLETCLDADLYYGDNETATGIETEERNIEEDPDKEDGGPGSGNHGHEGVAGQGAPLRHLHRL